MEKVPEGGSEVEEEAIEVLGVVLDLEEGDVEGGGIVEEGGEDLELEKKK
jgi:hypothetical protein